MENRRNCHLQIDSRVFLPCEGSSRPKIKAPHSLHVLHLEKEQLPMRIYNQRHFAASLDSPVDHKTDVHFTLAS